MLSKTILVLLAFAWSSAQAGSIGFSINFTANDIAIRNTGTEAAYQLSAWTLDRSAQWQAVQILSGNAAYLAPGKSLSSRRLSPAPDGAIGRADPLLLVLYDQAGGRFAHLAWRQTPALAQHPLPAQRDARQLIISQPDARADKIAATYGIVLPYEGVKGLALPLAAPQPPPNSKRHVWATGAPLVFDSGAGQAGAWLVHETATGELRMQIVPDGIVRGQEQTPRWLVWVRKYMMVWATLLAGLGGLVTLGGLLWSAKVNRHGQPASH